MNPSSDNLRRWDRTLVWHAFTQMAEYDPLILERGEGCYVFDIDGRRYLDATSSLWCNVHGHRRQRRCAAGRLDRHAGGGGLGVAARQKSSASQPRNTRITRKKDEAV
jgi:adenosylmethionine-8-amino-7-oxononanoate aminotransferase